MGFRRLMGCMENPERSEGSTAQRTSKSIETD